MVQQEPSSGINATPPKALEHSPLVLLGLPRLPGLPGGTLGHTGDNSVQLVLRVSVHPRQRRDPLLYWPRALFLICRLLAVGSISTSVVT